MNSVDSRVDCSYCLSRLQDLGAARAEFVYRVGNPAKPSFGHAMFFDSLGKIALHIAPKREESNASTN